MADSNRINWTPVNVQILLYLAWVHGQDKKRMYEKIRDGWPINPGEQKPSTRKFSDQLRKIRDSVEIFGLATAFNEGTGNRVKSKASLTGGVPVKLNAKVEQSTLRAKLEDAKRLKTELGQYCINFSSLESAPARNSFDSEDVDGFPRADVNHAVSDNFGNSAVMTRSLKIESSSFATSEDSIEPFNMQLRERKGRKSYNEDSFAFGESHQETPDLEADDEEEADEDINGVPVKFDLTPAKHNSPQQIPNSSEAEQAEDIDGIPLQQGSLQQVLDTIIVSRGTESSGSNKRPHGVISQEEDQDIHNQPKLIKRLRH